MTESSSASRSACGRGSDESPLVETLTRHGYVRLPQVERQIGEAVTLDGTTLVERARRRDKTAPDFLAPEALVYFIRRAIQSREVRIRDDLFRELLERCTPYFRSRFRGFARDDREDLQSEVQRMIIEDLFAHDDRSDFMQVRFWTCLERKCISVCRTTFRRPKNTEILEAGFSGEVASYGLSRLEKEADRQVSPEDWATISEGLTKLPPRLRRAFLLRHYVGMKIGSDNPAEDEPKELTIAAHFGRTGRTIRNWLKEADRLLAEFQEKHDGQ